MPQIATLLTIVIAAIVWSNFALILRKDSNDVGSLQKISHVDGTLRRGLDVVQNLRRYSNKAEEFFLKCLTEGSCGLQNQCTFKLDGVDESNSSNRTKSKNKSTLISGHIVAIKNKISEPMDLYWDVLTRDHSEKLRDKIGKINKIHVRPNSVSYVDTGVYGAHTVRLYVSKEGANERHEEEIEIVQTLVASAQPCTTYQACRLLQAVCYMASRDDLKCEGYQTACFGFYEHDSTIKDSCIAECIYTYWPEKISKFVDVDSDVVVEWIAKGGGVKGSKIDGLCDSSVIVWLVIFFVISLVINLIGLAFGFKYFKSKYSVNESGQTYNFQNAGTLTED